MKTAIVYYSMSGNTAFVAAQLAERLGADAIALEPVTAYPAKGFFKFLHGGKSALLGETPALKPYTFDASQYDAVILGTPVWAGSFAPPLRTFVRDNRDALGGKRIAAFVCCMGGGAAKTLGKLRALLETDAFAAELALIDPKTKPKPDTAQKLDAFCAALQ